MTKTERLLSKLESGSALTTEQIKTKFNIVNPSSVICKLRSEGHCIYTNQTILKTGKAAVKYSLGTPSKAMVAAAASAGFFSTYAEQ
jgi:hypothetical protein